MTLNYISPEEFLAKSRTCTVIDVRSPSEYLKGHIPNAINIPVFDDKERSEIGTLYKQKGHRESILYGLESIGPKLKSILTQVLELQANKQSEEILVHCHRGGLRSQSFVWLLELAKIKCSILQSGYKSYRHFVLDQFNKNLNMILISGETGCGKTAILKELRNRGEQVIDLEHLANHTGSVFGGIGKGKQPTAQQFENDLAGEIAQMNPEKRLWLENESPVIGCLHLPKDLVSKMRKAPIVQISLPVDAREKRILNEYSKSDLTDMPPLILKLKKYLGGKDCETALNGLNNENLHETVRILLNYYDKTYAHYRKKYNRPPLCHIDLLEDLPSENAGIILDNAISLGY